MMDDQQPAEDATAAEQFEDEAEVVEGVVVLASARTIDGCLLSEASTTGGR